VARFVERVFPFFDVFPLRSPKASDLAVFRQITQLVLSGRHLTPDGIRKLLEMRSPMNRGGKRRYSENQILAVLEDRESSEAIRRAPSVKQVDEDMVHAL